MNKVTGVLTMKKLFVPHYIIFCAAFTLQNTRASALDPSRHISQYAHTAWHTQDGYFAGTPQGITQSKDGYVWIATEAGPVRFDGVRFLPWTPPDGSHLPPQGIYSILGASDGSIWFGGAGSVALSRWTKGALVTYPSISGRINSIIEDDREGSIWVARSRVHDGTGPLCQITKGNAILCYAKADGIPFQYGNILSEDRSGSLWIGGNSMLARWKVGSPDIYTSNGLKPEEGLAGITSLAADPDGSLWVGMERAGHGLGLQRMVSGKWTPFRTPMMDGETLEVGALFVDRENALWVGTLNHGIYRIYKNSVDHFDSADGLSSNDINSFYQDAEGSLWVSTSRGIDCFRSLPVATFSTREGLTADRVGSVLASKDGTVWIGNEDALEYLREERVSSIRQVNGLPGREVTSMLQDHDGALWVGVDNSLFVFEKGHFEPINEPDGKPIGIITGMIEDVDKNIWATTVTGKPLIRIRDRRIQEEFDKTQIPGFRAFAPDPKGGIWLSLRNGDLARYLDSHLETIPVKKMANVSASYNLLADLNGAIWGATNDGLIRWWNETLKTLTVKNGLPCNDIYSFIRDKQNSLWLYTKCGLIVISDAELQRWWANPDTIIKFKTFDTFDGVQTSAADFRPDTVQSIDGKLWFAGQSILQMVDPSHEGENRTPPPVHIEQIVADRKTYIAQRELRLPPLVRDLEIDYTALSFVAPQKVRFRYRLDGHDTAWQEPGTRRQAFYNDLRPGNYQFRVIACNNDGVWNETGATFSFSIAPSFYQTTWFRLLLGLAAITLVWLLHSLRLRQATAHTHARLGERLNERGRIARELHDTLIQSIDGLMLRIQTALSESDPKRSRLMIEKALDSADEVMLEGRQRVNALRVEATTVKELSESLAAYGQGLSQDYPVAFSVTLVGSPSAIDAFVRDEAYCIGREALGNAFQHAGATKIEVEVTYSRRLVHMRVRDDGHGIDEQTLNAGRPGHWGLRGMRERAQFVGGKLVIWSRLGIGTEIDLEIPADVAYVGSRALWPGWIKKLIGDRRVMQ